MKGKAKIYATLVALVMIATVLPSVSATSTIGTLATVDDKNIDVLIERNSTASDISEMIGLSLDKDDTLYVSYYNVTDVQLNATFAAFEDSDDVVWFNVSITDMNATNRKVWFDDEAIDLDTASPALYVNESISDSDFCFVVTIPTDTEFTYGDYSFKYDDENFTVYDEDGDDIANLTSYYYHNSSGIYTLNLSDDSSSHQIVIVADDIHDTATAASGKRVTGKTLWVWPKTEAYTMSSEVTADYSLFTTTSGYLAFDVYNDYGGMLAKYIGGKTGIRMTESDFKYEMPKWMGLSSTLTDISTYGATISGINMGLIKYFYIDEGSGSDDDEVKFENYGVICSKGASTAVSGLGYLTMGGTRIPEAIIATGNANFI